MVIDPGSYYKKNKRKCPPYDLPSYKPIRVIKVSFPYGYGSAGDHDDPDYG